MSRTAAKFAQEKVPNEADRTQCLENIKTWVGNNLEHGRSKQVPNVLEEQLQNKNEFER